MGSYPITLTFDGVTPAERFEERFYAGIEQWLREGRGCDSVLWRIKYGHTGFESRQKCDLAGARYLGIQKEVILVEVETKAQAVSTPDSEGPRQAKDYLKFSNEVWLFSLQEIPETVRQDGDEHGYGLAKIVPNLDQTSFQIDFILKPRIHPNQNLPILDRILGQTHEDSDG